MSTQMIPGGAFGLVYFHTISQRGALVNTTVANDNIITVDDNYSLVTLTLGGALEYKFKNTQTGEIISFNPGDTTCGYTNPNKELFDVVLPQGVWELIVTFDELNPAGFICFSDYDNTNYVPVDSKLIPFKLMANQTILIPQNKKLFLGMGSISIDGTIFTSINKVKFTSGDKNVTAIEDSYGFFIE